MSIHKVLEEAVAAHKAPFLVAMAGNAEGLTFQGAVGQAASGRAADADTVFRIFSMTKAVGSVAAMILIDRGRISMDTPVEEVLPDWSKLQVLDGFDGDVPRLRTPRTRATLRHLATHTSGLEYEVWNAQLPRFMQGSEHPSMPTGLKAALMAPLTFDPGERWGYGRGIDWLGQVVEAVDGRRIDRFCQDEILEPLGMASTAFEPDGFEDRLSEVSIRGEDGRFGPMELAPPAQPEFYGMGHALYSTAGDYMRFLRMILNKGQLDGNRILSEAALAEMLRDQMQGKTFRKMISNSPVSADVDLPEGVVHSFMASLHTRDEAGKRSAGTQSWAGVCNSHYWVDPARDVAAVIMTQSLPFVEAPFLEAYDAFERAVYKAL